MQFTVKELNQGYTKEQLIEHQIKSELSGIFTDLEAAEKLYKLYPYFICCNNELYAFNDKMGMYTIDDNIIISIIIKRVVLSTLSTRNTLESKKHTDFLYLKLVIKNPKK